MTEINYNAIYEQCRIPRSARNRKLSACPGAEAIFDYVNSDRYTEDRGAGIGAVVHGAGAGRLNTFIAMARAMALMQDAVIYAHLQLIEHVVTEDSHPAYDDIVGARALFIQSAFDGSIDMPLTGYARMQVETFLRERTERGQRNYFSMSRPLLEAGWWSMDFRMHQNEACRSFEA
jgi:hypothetical protein